MGEKTFKTNLETELEKALTVRNTQFCVFERDLLKEILDTGCLSGPVPKEIKEYLGQKLLEYHAAQNSLTGGWNESFAEVICEGMFAKQGNFFKQRFAEINGFIIYYKPILDSLENLEKAYSEGSVAEKLIVSCMREGTPDSVLYVICIGCNMHQLGIERSYRNKYRQFDKYEKGKKLNAKEFVDDLMKLIGA